MFGSRSYSSGPFKIKWWMLILVGLVGLALLFAQPSGSRLSDFGPAASITPVAPTPPTGRTADSGLQLPEYDPATHNAVLSQAPDERSWWLVAGDLALKLVVVVVLIYLVIAGLRWMQRNRRLAGSKGTTIRILETTGVAPGRALHLVVVGSKTLLIGSTEHHLSLLAELPDVVAPLSDEDGSAFGEAMRKAENAGRTPPEWHAALDQLRAGVRLMHSSPGSEDK